MYHFIHSRFFGKELFGQTKTTTFTTANLIDHLPELSE